MSNHKTKAFAVLCASVIICSNIAPATFAISASAKEEVVYANITPEGNVTNIDVVNILTPSDSQVLDYGDYSSVRNMTTTDQLTYKDGTVSASTSADKIYYDGRAKSTILPWNISVKYYLDGNKISADELAGKSGTLRIKVDVTKNTSYTGPDFYKNYALQGTIKLDGAHCKNIVSDKATIANVGQQKQLSYIALPNKGYDFDITTDVTDFEYDGIAINAIPLTLNVEVNDDKLMSQVKSLQDAIVQVDDGANALNGGLQSLKTGLDSASSSINNINTTELQLAINKAKLALENANLINENGAKLIAASAQIKVAIHSLVENTAQLKNGVNPTVLDNYYTQNNINIGNLSAQNKAVITDLTTQITGIKNQIKAIQESEAAAESAEQLAALQAQVTQLEQIVALIDGNDKTLNGADTITRNYLNGINDKISKLQSGAELLETKYTQFDENLKTFIEALSQLSRLAESIQGVVNSYKRNFGQVDSNFIAKMVAGYNAIVTGANRIIEGGASLANGTSTLRGATSTLDDKVDNEINALLDAIKGNAHIGSFVSNKNTQVNAVQFVIKSSKIVKPKTETVKTEDKKDESFFDKLFNLFR